MHPGRSDIITLRRVGAPRVEQSVRTHRHLRCHRAAKEGWGGGGGAAAERTFSVTVSTNPILHAPLLYIYIHILLYSIFYMCHTCCLCECQWWTPLVHAPRCWRVLFRDRLYFEAVPTVAVSLCLWLFKIKGKKGMKMLKKNKKKKQVSVAMEAMLRSALSEVFCRVRLLVESFSPWCGQIHPPLKICLFSLVVKTN